MESPEVSQFRQFILNGMWAKAEAALERLGVDDEEGLWVCGTCPRLTLLTSFMSGCKISNKPTEISGIYRSKETNISIAGPAS